MKSREEIVNNWLPRYTGETLENFGKYIYYATKAFVLSFTEALAVEMKDTEVSIKALCPGPTNTGFVGTANLEKSGLFKHIKNTTAKEVANYGFKKIKKRKIVIVHGFFNKILVFGSKILPRALVRNFVYLIQKNKDACFLQSNLLQIILAEIFLYP